MLPPELRLAGLLHDAHEAYTGDISRPMKELIKTYMSAWLSNLEALIQSIIYEKFRVFLAPEEWKRIKHADNVLLSTEASRLFGVDPTLDPESWSYEKPDTSVPFTNLSQRAAKDFFLAAFEREWGGYDV